MSELLGALVAGVLTTLAPCVLPLLPTIVGGSLVGGRRRVWLIASGLGVSVITFTLLLKGTTALLAVPASVWTWLSGGLLIALGLASVFPHWWDRLSAALHLQDLSQRGLRSATRHDGWVGAVLTGAALGPVFSSCSPLYGYVIVTVLPADATWGVLLLGGYVVGLVATLVAIALVGRRLIGRLRAIADPDGWFRRALGVVFVLVGVAVITGADRAAQAWLIEQGAYIGV